MRFADPLFLLALLGVAVPIAVHLINRKKATRVPFPALAFVKKSLERTARRWKIKRWVLLALRISLFVLLPLAMARPAGSCGGEAAGGAGDARLPASVVIVLDASGSMSANPERATRAATRAVRELRAWDRVALVVAGPTVSAPVSEPTEERGPVLRAIEDVDFGAGVADLDAALRMAADIQRGESLPVTRTIVISDGQAAAWPEAVDPEAWAGVGELSFEAIPLPEENCAVYDVRHARSEDGGGVRVDASVRCWGEAPRSLTAALEVAGEERAEAAVEWSEGGVGSLTFATPIEGREPVSLAVRLAQTAGSTSDDVAFAVHVPDRRTRALLVNGDPRAVNYNDELFYLRRALSAGLERGRGAEARVVSVEGLAGENLERTDVVVLANVATLPPLQVQRLRTFVEGGGGLLLSAGDQVEPQRWNASLAPLLAKPVRDVKVLTSANAADAALHATRVAQLDALHPIFRAFSLPGGESVQDVVVYRYLLLVPEADTDARIVASYADGGPALVERPVGEGRVALWTTTLDIDWTDFAIRTAYLPLVRRLVDYLARRGSSGASTVELGRSHRVDVSALDAERVIVVAEATGARRVRRVSGAEVQLEPATLGPHAVWVGWGEREVAVPELAFAVNPPAAEFDPTPIAPETLEAWASEVTSAPSTPGDALRPNERPLWPGLLLLALLAMYAETLVGVRRRVWTRLRGGAA